MRCRNRAAVCPHVAHTVARWALWTDWHARGGGVCDQRRAVPGASCAACSASKKPEGHKPTCAANYVSAATLSATHKRWKVGQAQEYTNATIARFIRDDEAFRRVAHGRMAEQGTIGKDDLEFELLCSSLKWEYHNFFRNEVARLVLTLHLRNWSTRYDFNSQRPRLRQKITARCSKSGHT